MPFFASRACYELQCAAAVLAVLATLPASAQRLVIVSSGDSPSYEQALAGIQKSGFASEALNASTANDATIKATIAGLGRDAAVITLGAHASALVARAATTAPIVNCMASGDDGKAAPGTTVVPLTVPAEIGAQWLKKLLPTARNVGVLFDPAQNEHRAAEAAAALTRAGYVPVLEPVSGPSALPSALARLNSVDVLYAIPDTTVFAREHLRALLLFSFRNRIPLVGPSEAWVRAGALYAVDWDYQELGRYCAALALRQVGGGKAAMPAPPRSRAVVNARSAEQLRIKWDAETLREVEQVRE